MAAHSNTHYSYDPCDIHTWHIDDSVFISYSIFCSILSAFVFLGILTQAVLENEKCVFEQIKMTRLRNPKKIMLGHLNINSIPNKLDGIMELVQGKLDIFLISETKIDSSFPDAQFSRDGYSIPHRKDRKLGAGGLLMYVNENIPSRLLNGHTMPADIELICVEINLKKQKWLIMGVYRPPNMSETYFLNHLCMVTDFYSRYYDRIIIMGDFNLEPTDEPIDTFCNSYNLNNLVKGNTCFKGPPKCYDLILTTHKHSFQNTQILTTGFSDFHSMTTTILKTEFVKADPIQINYRNYKNYNPINFNEDLKQQLCDNNTTNKTYEDFHSILCQVLDKHAPIKSKCLRANNSPFMTKQLRKLIMNRSRCKNAFFKNKTVDNWEKYRRLRNECVKLTKKAKREYFDNLSLSNITDNKHFWKTVKPFFTNKQHKNPKIILVENDEIINDNKKNAEIMNNYFVNVTKGLDIPDIICKDVQGISDIEYIDPIDQIIYKYNEHPSILKINNYIKSSKNFSFENITPPEIEKEILELNPKKAAGSDSIPPKILKDGIGVIKSPLTQLFNISVEECHFPLDLKKANVAPLFKKDDNTNKENYRPISILPCISKVFERIMFRQVATYTNNVLSPHLCGFRKGYNTQHILMRLKNNLNISLDRKEKVGLLLMDLSKAFDCIPHELLIAKLHAYGFDKQSLKFIYSYLKGRSQRVKINADYSSWKEILSGVPQGSVLGPLLFNIFINDIFFFVENSELYNYADDNTLSVADISIETIISKLETDINVLNIWFKNNGMILNESKCNFMIVETSRSQREKTEKIKIQNKHVNEVKNAKLLGITLDKNVTMNEHINKICKQAANKLHALARIAHFLNEHKRKILMKTFITSQFNYCPIIWMYCQRKSNNLINRIHERALRIAYNDYVSNFETLLSMDDTVTFHQRNIQILSQEVYKTLQDKNPVFMNDIFELSNHNYYTRRQRLTYPKPHTVTYGLESFGYRASQIWSSIPREIQNTENISSLKTYVATNCNALCKCNLCKPYITNVGYIP